MDKDLLRHLLDRSADSNKYDFGHVLVVGGTPGMVGAPLLAGMAALRTGAGLVTIAAPASVTSKLERRVKEIMTLTLPDNPGKATETLLDFVNKRKVNASVFGPGLKPETAANYLDFLKKLAHPVVIDAGGLVMFRSKLDQLKHISHNADLILTPHAGEYKKLAGASLPDNEKEIAKEISDRATSLGLTIVLKGHRTLIAHPDGTTHRNTNGNPGLATAGTGDVLAGIIAGLLAQNVPAAEAAQAGVYIHGLAGDLAVADKTQAGIIASDVIEFIPKALQNLRAHNYNTSYEQILPD